MKNLLFMILFATIFQDGFSQDSVVTRPIYSFKVKNIDGDSVSLNDYSGKVLLLVNVASECGYTPQYDGLERIYNKYKEKGFEILGFPANNFGQQEPGSDQQIKSFCSSKFNVTFPMFSKISVKGTDISPFYKFLTDMNENGVNGEPIKWNFQKILVGRDGVVIKSFAPSVKPEDNGLKTEIEKALLKK